MDRLNRLKCWMFGHLWHYYGLKIIGLKSVTACRQCTRCGTVQTNHYMEWS